MLGGFVGHARRDAIPVPDSHRRHARRDLRKQLIAKKLQESTIGDEVSLSELSELSLPSELSLLSAGGVCRMTES